MDMPKTFREGLDALAVTRAERTHTLESVHAVAGIVRTAREIGAGPHSTCGKPRLVITPEGAALADALANFLGTTLVWS